MTGVTTDYTVDPDSNRLRAVSEGGEVDSYAYDATGNTVFDGEYLYTYNARGRLTKVDNAKDCTGPDDTACIGEIDGDTGEYLYNALGQRVYKKGKALAGDANGDGKITPADVRLVNGRDGKSVDCDKPARGKRQGQGKGQQVACVASQIGAYANQGQATDKGKGRWAEAPMGVKKRLFAYEDWKLLGEYKLDGSAVQETVWLGNIPVATVRGGKVYYIHADHLGTPRVITDPDTRTVVWRWDSDPFGRAEADEDPDGDGQPFGFNLRFPGQYFDAETGLHYNYFRDYDPSAGRYIESDPIGLEGGLNAYVYVSSRPNIRLDFFGLAEICNVGVPFSLGTPHSFLCANGRCGGKHSEGSGAALYSATSQIKDDSLDKPKASCSGVPEKNCDPESFDNCIVRKISPRDLNEPYLFSGANCGAWVEETILECWNICKKKKP